MTPFEGDGVWLRCALHAHTTNSDGEMSPDMLARHYQWAGFDVLAITDHWVRTVERSTRKLLVIPSTELNATCGAESEDAHVLALGVQADPVAPGDGFAPLPEVVAWIVENGGVPYLAHTYWSGLPVDGMEVVIRPDRGWGTFPTNDGLTLLVVGWPFAESTAYKTDVEANYLKTLELAPEIAADHR